MKEINRLRVLLDIEGDQHEVGELALDANRIYFKYYPCFLDTGLRISPFKLPTSKEILTTDTTIFDGLFGVFNDSLPDGWGRLILDRNLLSNGINLNSITPLDRLSYVGLNGIGALVYQPVFVSKMNLILA